MFGAAFKYVKSWIDPGLYGDPYADEPYLYGPALSSVNTFCIGGKPSDASKAASQDKGGKKVERKKKEDDLKDEFEDLGDDGEDEEHDVLTEGAEDSEAEEIREDHGIPWTGPLRQKHFLDEENRKTFQFEQGRVYKCDFFNGYLDFNGTFRGNQIL
jgi:Protein of unknown function (DUF1769)